MTNTEQLDLITNILFLAHEYRLNQMFEAPIAWCIEEKRSSYFFT